MSHRDAKGNENVIPAKAGIQKTKELDSRLHGNDGLEVFSCEKFIGCIQYLNFYFCIFIFHLFLLKISKHFCD